MTDPAPIIQPGELHRLRKAAGLTQAALGNLAGVSRDHVNAHENGRQPITLQASSAYRYVLETDELRKQLDHMARKQEHGCTDAYCRLCDG